MPEEKARVFISYARNDGEEFAQDLLARVEGKGIPCWLDRVQMKGGQDWWQQIKDALNTVEFFVLVMTPAAIESQWTRKEWVYARQQGVCVYPVIASSDLNFDALPRWMRDVHFYDLEHQWAKFINDLNTRCQVPRVPFMVEDLPENFVERPKEFEQLVASLLDEDREEPRAITTALRGAGGFGKTTLAMALCHDDTVQQAFHDGILWVTLGENPGELVGRVTDLITRLSGETPIYNSIEAVSDHLAELLADRDILIVIDDVWEGAHLRPFLRGGDHCTRLVTTRNAATLPTGAVRIDVDAMQQSEAVELLGTGLEHNHRAAFQNIAARLGEWPLLLKLVNARLRQRVREHGQSLDAALTYIHRALDKRGMTAFDIRDTEDRNQAVDVTLGLSLELLHGEEAARYLELAVFPEDVDIPLDTLATYWAQTGGLDELDTEDLCERFAGLSLLLRYDLARRTIRLHDVVRDYLLHQAGDDIIGLHNTLLASYNLTRWADLPDYEPYLWDHLAEHLIVADRVAELVETVQDMAYLARKSWLKKSYAVENDLQRTAQALPESDTTALLLRSYRHCGHLLNQCRHFRDLQTTLNSRFQSIPVLKPLAEVYRASISPACLYPYRSLPDMPSPALIRTLEGHTNAVNTVAISRDGSQIVSGSDDNTVRVWDAGSGELRHTLEGHTGLVRTVAISRDGSQIVSGSDDKTVRVWDARTGEYMIGIHLEGTIFSVAISPDGRRIIAGGAGGLYFFELVK